MGPARRDLELHAGDCASSAGRPGSISATAISPPTSSARGGLQAGETLTDITARIAAELGVAARILPMTDDPVRTVVETDAGTLAFQEYFVRDQCRPAVRRIRYDGADTARPTPQVLAGAVGADLAGIIICPSNPWLSVDPILAVPGMREAMRASGAPVIAVSPIIGGKAVKGPTAKIMAELGIAPGARASRATMAT